MELIEIILICLILYCICSKCLKKKESLSIKNQTEAQKKVAEINPKIVADNNKRLDKHLAKNMINDFKFDTSDILNRAELIYSDAVIEQQLKKRKELITNETKNLEFEINKVSVKTQEDLNNWISDSENVFSWDNINKKCNKIIIKKATDLKLSNIQVWGTGIINNKEVYKNWAKHTRPTEFDNGIGATVKLTDSNEKHINSR